MPNSKIIIGIDPGTAITGYGIVECTTTGKYIAMEYGVIRTSATVTDSERLKHIYSELTALIQEYTPEAAGCEQIFFSKNVRTATTVLQSRGVVLLALAQHNIPIIELTPPQIKLAITGYGGANKNQMQYMTQQLLNLTNLPQPDDAADALAVAIASYSLC